MDPAIRQYLSRIGRKAAKARLEKIPPEERSRIASEAAKARWSKTRDLPWKVAKTYQDAPHEYVLRHQAPEGFDWYKDKIKAEGRAEKFTLRGRTLTYRYYYAGDGFKYWIVWPGPVLNRARICAS